MSTPSLSAAATMLFEFANYQPPRNDIMDGVVLLNHVYSTPVVIKPRSDCRPPTQEEIAKGVPLTFYVREMARPSGRLDKEYYDSNGVKYRSIAQIMKN